MGTAGRNSGSTFRFAGLGAGDGRRGTELMDVAQQVSRRRSPTGKTRLVDRRIGADRRMKMAAVLGKRRSLCGKIQQQPLRLGRSGTWTGGGRWTVDGQEMVARPVSLPRSAVVCLVGRFRRGRVVARRAGGLAAEGGSVVRCGARRQECRVESCFCNAVGGRGVAGTIFGEREEGRFPAVMAVVVSGFFLPLLWVEEATFF